MGQRLGKDGRKAGQSSKSSKSSERSGNRQNLNKGSETIVRAEKRQGRAVKADVRYGNRQKWDKGRVKRWRKAENSQKERQKWRNLH